jgi:hypothetical protein
VVIGQHVISSLYVVVILLGHDIAFLGIHFPKFRKNEKPLSLHGSKSSEKTFLDPTFLSRLLVVWISLQ